MSFPSLKDQQPPLQMMYKSQFRKMDPYGFVVQGHILCLIYKNIISAFVTAG